MRNPKRKRGTSKKRTGKRGIRKGSQGTGRKKAKEERRQKRKRRVMSQTRRKEKWLHWLM